MAMLKSPILEKMVNLSFHWESSGDQRFAFLKCYGMMTANMLIAVDQDQFVDADWVRVLLEHFAEYYFQALDAYQQFQGSSPRVWQVAFNAASQPDLQLVQHLLLGVNAHINYDLVFAVVDLLSPEWYRLSSEERATRYQDYCLVNEIIHRTIDAVQDDILERNNVILRLLDTAMVKVDEWMIGQLVDNWRDRVWAQAIELIDCKDEKTFIGLQNKVEARALRLANWIMGQPLLNRKDGFGRFVLSEG